MAKILTVFLALMVCASPLFCDEAADRKREIEKLKNEAAQKEKELKKYREQEKKISKEISALEDQKVRAQRLKNKVESDITYVEQNLLSIEEKRAALERSMPMWQGVVEEELERYYFTPFCAYCLGGYSLEQDIFVNRMVTHKAAFAAELKKENQEAKERIHSFEERNRRLLEQSSKIKEEQAIISQSFNKKQKDLDVTKRKADAVRREINELNKSAAELNNLLASFERKRKAADAKKAAASKTPAKKTGTGPKIDAARKSLPWPVEGKVISKFGKEYRADLNTWIFRDGIKIAAKSGEPVRSAEAGSVIYAGPFRSYGNVVIVDHNKGFFTIYGFIKEISVSVGDKLPQQGVLGTAGRDTQSSSGTGQSAVYFEIRQGTTAVDPLEWLK
ncbi:murein hydrolase activator EnvC family protein [Candidatus Avelusimicrobium alvi]|uniref:murein hydrolase activator EnvC family protein n=1 Tax=Candidatus Avelusimicrobium alvi TaxID=3416221 RepID=UPI003D0F9585